MSRDIDYENNNVAYLDHPEEDTGDGIICKNYELCESVLPKWWFGCKGNYLCTNCDMLFGELEFKKSDEECVVCNEFGNTLLNFPANCGHWFCVKCSGKILFYDESRYYISPVPFGCPPCPNRCKQPIRGKQEHCDTCDEIKELWEIEHPEQYNEYIDIQDVSIGLADTMESGSVYSSNTCPLCRTEYNGHAIYHDNTNSHS